MTRVHSLATLCPEGSLESFIKTLNSNLGCFTELAVADPGTSRFNKAHYFEELTKETLLDLSGKEMNLCFSSGYEKELLQPLVLGTKTTRKGSDSFMKLKNIISFDLDFKDHVPDYHPDMNKELKAEFQDKIVSIFSKNKVPLWMMVFTGHGIHLHFKLTEPYEVRSVQKYKKAYDSCLSYFECLLSYTFDKSCSNPARLMRLPFSTNWKDKKHPIPCEVLYFSEEAGFASLWNGFCELHSDKEKNNKTNSKDKRNILASLDLKKVLEHFSYEKMESIKEKGSQLLCSSPFKKDSNPSFHYDSSRKVFYDFSTSYGGDLFHLVGLLANLDTKKDFRKILNLSAKIAGIQLTNTDSYGFKLDSKGLWFQSSHDADPIWLSSPLYIEALTRDASSRSWGRLLTFKDGDDKSKFWSMPMELLAGDGSEIRRHLLSLGLEISTAKKERSLFLSYLQSTRPTKRTQCVKRIGWHSGQFVLPNKVISPPNETTEVILQSKTEDLSFGTRGTLEEWKKEVASLCTGNSRLAFSVSVAFASALLKLTGDENGGFHFVGSSSIGKSITLKVAASVWGDPGLNGFVKRWRSTLNGLELQAISRCDSLLILDELGEVQPKDAGNAAYMLSGGISKNRATKDTLLAEQLEWRMLFLSSGEITLASHIAESGQKVNVGQEVRMIDLPAESKGSFGVFDHIHDFESAGKFASTISDKAEKYFGTPIQSFLEKIIKEKSLIEKINTCRREFSEQAGEIGHGQVHRALKRFSLVAAAGELAIELKILPWKKNEALTASLKLFSQWKNSWTRTGSREFEGLVLQVKSLLQEFGPSRFPLWEELREKSHEHHQKLWGFRKKSENGYDWFVLSEIFRNEFCKGHDYRRATRELKENSFIKNPSTPMRVPHLGITRIVTISGKVMSDL